MKRYEGHRGKYVKGLGESTADARKRKFKEQLREYKHTGNVPDEKRPGDSKKTRPSKYTKRANALMEKMAKSDRGKKSSFKKSIEKIRKKFGIPKKIADQVVSRGIAAWASGSRPGTNKYQWGKARLYSFATGGKASKTADKKLYQQWKKGK